MWLLTRAAAARSPRVKQTFPLSLPVSGLFLRLLDLPRWPSFEKVIASLHGLIIFLSFLWKHSRSFCCCTKERKIHTYTDLRIIRSRTGFACCLVIIDEYLPML